MKRGFSAAGSVGFDADNGSLQFVSAQTTYNWDCCGVTMEYRSYTVANVRTENLFRFTFTWPTSAASAACGRRSGCIERQWSAVSG